MEQHVSERLLDIEVVARDRLLKIKAITHAKSPWEVRISSKFKLLPTLEVKNSMWA